MKALESKDYVLGGTKLRLINGSSSNMLRKENNDAILTNRTRNLDSQWEIELI